MASPYTRSTLRVFGGSSHPELTASVAKKVGVRPGEVKLAKFANKETCVQILENVRGESIYLIQTGGTATPNDDLMELLLLINAFKLAASGNITVITPIFPYSKRDRKYGSRVPISSKLVADLIKRAGASYVMMLDPHTPQLEGFFDNPVDAIKVNPLFCEWIKHHVPSWQDCVVVSPDEGGAKKSVSVAIDLGLEFALIHSRHEAKHREQPSSHNRTKTMGSDNEAGKTTPVGDEECKQPRKISGGSGRVYKRKIRSLSGDVAGKTVIIVDDMIDAGHTLKYAAEVLRREGATAIYMLSTHGIFSPGGLEVIRGLDKSFLKAVVVSNSIPQEKNLQALNGEDEDDKILHIIDVSGLIAEFIRRHHYRESVSVLSQFMPIRDEPKGTTFRRKHNNGSRNRQEKPAAMSNGQDGHPEVAPLAEAEADLASLELAEQREPESEELSDEEDDDDFEHDEEGEVLMSPPEAAHLQRLRKGFRLSSVCWEERP